jgi:hypothetical protein
VVGFNSKLWYSNPYIDIVFQEAVAESSENGVYYRNVIITDVSDETLKASSIPSRFLRGLAFFGIEALPTLPSVKIGYVISQVVRDFNNSISAYNSISRTLRTSVEEGYFTAYLRGFAKILGVKELYDVSSSEVTVLSFTSAPTLSPTRLPKEKLSAGSIAAITVGAFIGFLLLIFLVRCSAQEEKSKPGKLADSNENNAVIFGGKIGRGEDLSASVSGTDISNDSVRVIRKARSGRVSSRAERSRNASFSSIAEEPVESIENMNNTGSVRNNSVSSDTGMKVLLRPRNFILGSFIESEDTFEYSCEATLHPPNTVTETFVESAGTYEYSC